MITKLYGLHYDTHKIEDIDSRDIIWIALDNG